MLQRLLMVLMFLTLAAPLAQAAPSTSTADFTDNGDGTATHKITGLTWKRCVEGLIWTGTTCGGERGGFTWAQAIALNAPFAGKNDWRLPNIRELSTIIERGSSPAINTTIFPGLPTSYLWSASVYGASSVSVWSFGLALGYDGPDDKTNKNYALLVRGEQPPAGLLAIGRPTGDYVDNGDGTATHTPTNLTWKRCAEGQTWNGSACEGEAKSYRWTKADTLTQTYAGESDWRLPTLEELRSMVDFTPGNPAINGTIFPNQPKDTAFWSSSMTSSGYSAWGIYFGYGHDSPAGVNDYAMVRFVRSGHPPAGSSMANCLFDWVEKTYPQIFSPVSGKSQTMAPYYYRQYADNVYLATSSKDNHLYYLMGGGMGDAGLASQWYATAGCK